jgi:hypothetical protein
VTSFLLITACYVVVAISFLSGSEGEMFAVSTKDKIVLVAGAKAKTMTSNLPLLSM